MPSPKIAVLPAVIGSDIAIQTQPGKPLPLGVHVQGTLTNFCVFADGSVTLVLFLSGSEIEVPLSSTGQVWHIAVSDLPNDFEYGYRREGIAELLLDPYARMVSGSEVWREEPTDSPWESPWERVRQRRSRFVATDDFDWGTDQPVRIPYQQSVIYELHTRGFTQHPSSKVQRPGTYLGLIEKIDHLQKLGVTSVELLPIMEWEENDNPRSNQTNDERLVNYWGYHTLSFFAPRAGLASQRGREVDEFRTMVKELHRAGIEVILDVVYNHTGETDAECPTFCFRGLADSVYYATDAASGAYRNDTGCGNTVSTNHPVVQDLIIDSLRYWVTEMHVDGFRFDLAAIFNRGANGEVLDQPPIISRIENDPVLSGVKLIAEPWDAAGLYKVGSFAKAGRWAEWNDHYRDDIRSFVRGDAGMTSALAARLSGSRDVYDSPHASINYVACHDGFTLADVVSYNGRHNQANGEDGRDGTSDNRSWNCGAEGWTEDSEINALRTRQIKNMATLLFLSQGVPMFQAGDEFGRSQNGNNNTYCHDSELTWLDWGVAESNKDLVRFFGNLAIVRKEMLPRWYVSDGVQHNPTITWHGCEPFAPGFNVDSRSIAMHISGHDNLFELYVIANAYWEQLVFKLPAPSGGARWHRVIDTSLASPLDIVGPGEVDRAVDGSYAVGPRSVVVLCVIRRGSDNTSVF